jgi:hypothetical protein
MHNNDTMHNNDNIHFLLTEDDDDSVNDSEDVEFNLSEILNKLDDIEINNELENELFSEMIHYDTNYNVKQLLLICDYYKISKFLRAQKSNKDDIIRSLVFFEQNPSNYEIVLKRKQLWFYINEIKNDKFMKKYVLWN